MPPKKLLWLSNSPTTPSAFGKVTAEVCTRLLKRGYDVIAAGNQTQTSSYRYGDLLVLGRLRHEFFADVIRQYMQLYNRDYFITFTKISSLQWIPQLYLDLCTKWIAYATIESELMPPAEETLYPAREALAVLAPSKFNYNQLKKYIDTVYLCQLGVNEEKYYPESKDVIERERVGIGIRRDDFVFGTVSMNLWDRKDLPRLIKAFSIFRKRNPDANVWLYLHTNIRRAENERSYPLGLIAAKYGVADRILSPKYNPELRPFSDDQMRILYNIFDVYITATRGESFCIPILESMACGTPAIAPKHTALPELIGEGNERGWLVKCSDTIIPLYFPEFDEQHIVDTDELVKTMEHIYYNREEIESRKPKCIEFARTMSWDRLIDEQLIPALEEICGSD